MVNENFMNLPTQQYVNTMLAMTNIYVKLAFYLNMFL